MATISQETWDNMPSDEKQRLQTEYAGAMVNSKENITAQLYERLFGKENLQPKPMIRTWEDVEKLLPEDGFCVGEFEKYADNPKVTLKCQATLKIAKLIELGYGGIVTDEEYRQTHNRFWGIWVNDNGEIECTEVEDCRGLLTFHTQHQAEEFMSYPENRRLVEQYHML